MKKTILLIVQITFFIFLYFSYAFAEPAKIISVYVQREEIRIKLSEKTKYNVVKLDKKELFISFDNATKLDTGFKKHFTEDSIAEEIAYGKLKKNRTAFIYNMKANFEIKEIMWIADNTLLIQIRPLDFIIIKAESKQEKQEKLIKIKQQQYKQYKLLLKGEYTGSTDDLIYYIKNHKCFMRSLTLMKVKGFIDAGEFAATYRMLNNYVENNRITSSYMDECDEIIYYLYTYSYSKIMNFENTDDLFQFEHLLLEVLSYFPNSDYKVFVYAYLGKIKTALKQYAEAEAYFRIILNNHTKYIGTPEVLQK